MLWKCCTQYASKSGKLSNGHRTRKGHFHSNPKERQCQRMFKLPHIITHLTCWQSNAKFSKPGFNSTWTMNFQMFKLDLEKAEEPEISFPTSTESERAPEKHLLLLYCLCQSLWLCRSQQTVENSSRHGNTRPPELRPEKSVCRSRSNS